MSSSWAIIAESYSFIWQPYVAKWYFFMWANVEKNIEGGGIPHHLKVAMYTKA